MTVSAVCLRPLAIVSVAGRALRPSKPRGTSAFVGSLRMARDPTVVVDAKLEHAALARSSFTLRELFRKQVLIIGTLVTSHRLAAPSPASMPHATRDLRS